MEDAPKKWRADTIRGLMRLYYKLPEWVIVFEVPNQSVAATRRGDAIAMNMWPSRGLEIHGFEIKVDRNDWLSELANGPKAETIAGYCDRWWIVAPADVAMIDEIPKGWGSIVPTTDGLVVVRQGELLNAQPIDRPFVAALFRGRFQASQAETAVVSDELRRSMEARIEREVRQQVEFKTYVATERARRADELEAALGTPVLKWPPPQELANLIKLVSDCSLTTEVSRLRRIVDAMRSFIDEVGAPLALTDAQLKWQDRLPANEEEKREMCRDFGGDDRVRLFTNTPARRPYRRRAAT